MNRDELFREVVKNIESPVDAISFTRALEDHYRTSIAAGRRSSMLIAGGIGLAIIWLFVIEHAAFVVPSMSSGEFWRWVALMSGLNLLVGGYMMVHAFVGSHRLRDGMSMMIMVLISVLACLQLYTEIPHLRAIGMFSYVLMPVACCNLVWLHFRQALFVTLASFACWVVFLSVVPDGDPQVKFIASTVLISAGTMALWANYRTDRGERTAFLWLTRERLLSEMSQRQNAELREMSAVDPLTGLANRRAFEENFRRLETSRAGDVSPLAVMMIDIDHFKMFNDHYGHPEGDHCLQSVAMALAAQLRSREDLVARLGGEEFVVVMPGLLLADVEGVLERLRGAVEGLAIPHLGVRDNPDDVVTISIGCAVATATEADKRHMLLTLADGALYRAKREGRNRWRLA